MSRTYPERHSHRSPQWDGKVDPEIMAECIVIDSAFASWLMKRHLDNNDVLDMATVRAAWRAAWVEGVISERFRVRLAPLPDHDN